MRRVRSLSFNKVNVARKRVSLRSDVIRLTLGVQGAEGGGYIPIGMNGESLVFRANLLTELSCCLAGSNTGACDMLATKILFCARGGSSQQPYDGFLSKFTTHT